jgi:hypothetical protein
MKEPEQIIAAKSHWDNDELCIHPPELNKRAPIRVETTLPEDPPGDDIYAKSNNEEDNDQVNEADQCSGELERNCDSEVRNESVPREEASSSSNPILDRLMTVVRVQRVCPLTQLIKKWCERHQIDVLPVSGLIISVGSSHDKDGTGEQHILCDDEIVHSRLISMQESSRELDFEDFEANLAVPNCESDLSSLQHQSLVFKLWFVPVVTKAMIEQVETSTMNAYSLNGCQVAATAYIPLYHLYTPQAYFDGKVPWQISRGSLNDNLNLHATQGYIQATVHKLNDNSPRLESLLTRRQSIDPPTCTHLSNKRKTNNLTSTLRGFKRSRFLQNESESSATLLTAANDNPATDVESHDCSSKIGDANERPSFKSPEADKMSVEMPCCDLKHNSENETKESIDNHTTQVQDCSKPTPPQTCERASSPVLAVLRYADVGVCTSPLGENSQSDTNNADQFNSDNKVRHPSRSSLSQRLGHDGGGYDSIWSHRLRSQQHQTAFSYFASPKHSRGTVEGVYRSVRSPTSLQHTSNLLNRRHTVSSNYQSPVNSMQKPLRSNNKSPTKDGDECGARSQSAIKTTLSNRERIERIFSSKT